MSLTAAAADRALPTAPAERVGSVAANVLLSVPLIGQALRALRRPPSQRDLWLMAAATGSLLLVSRALAVPGSPFPDHNSDIPLKGEPLKGDIEDRVGRPDWT